MKYRFDAYELDTVTQELRCDDELVPIEPQVFALLELLLANPDRVVSKDELNERIWGGRIVSEAAVSSRVRSARQAIGDNGAAQRLIKTVRGRGFRFVGTVDQLPVTNVSFNPPPSPATAKSAASNRSNPSIAVLPIKLVSLDSRYEPLAELWRWKSSLTFRDCIG